MARHELLLGFIGRLVNTRGKISASYVSLQSMGNSAALSMQLVDSNLRVSYLGTALSLIARNISVDRSDPT